MTVQLFAFSSNPFECVQWLCDKHVVNQPRETVQILNTAIHLHDGETFYTPTHEDHPCVQWAAQSLKHWRWCVYYAEALQDEYKYRYDNGTHLSVLKLRASDLWDQAHDLMDDEYWVDPPRAFSEYDSDEDSVWMAYRDYYKNHKQHTMEFKFDHARNKPRWLTPHATLKGQS